MTAAREVSKVLEHHPSSHMLSYGGGTWEGGADADGERAGPFYTKGRFILVMGPQPQCCSGKGDFVFCLLQRHPAAGQAGPERSRPLA